MNHQVLSPVPGVCYLRPSPDEPRFVEIGTLVEGGTIVALVEVMKTFHEILAGEPGIVMSVEAGDATMVNAGQVLMTIATESPGPDGEAA